MSSIYPERSQILTALAVADLPDCLEQPVVVDMTGTDAKKTVITMISPGKDQSPQVENN